MIKTKNKLSYEKILAMKNYYIENRDSILQYKKKYRQENLERIKQKAKNHYFLNREAFLLKSKNYQKNNYSVIKAYKSRPSTRFSYAKRIAHRNELVWNISFDEFSKLIMRNCEYCNSPLELTGSGLDRMNNKNGYSIENVVPCCKICNSIKGCHLSYQEMKIAMKAILEFRGRGK